MKKRVLMSLVLLTMIGVSVAFAQEALLKFTDVQGGVSVAGKSSKETVGDITIPDTYNGKKVVAVATNGFKGYTGITGLKISNNVIEINNSAFEGCNNIIEIRMGDGVTTIGINAFKGCSKLRVLTGANIGASVKRIRSSAFENCGALERVWIRESVTNIDDKAFNNCNKLNRINFQRADTVVSLSAFPGNLAEAYKAGGKGPYDVLTWRNYIYPQTWGKAN
jgi:hypothetical protein